MSSPEERCRGRVQSTDALIIISWMKTVVVQGYSQHQITAMTTPEDLRFVSHDSRKWVNSSKDDGNTLLVTFTLQHHAHGQNPGFKRSQ